MDAKAELADHHQTLMSAQAELEDQRQETMQKLSDAKAEIESGKEIEIITFDDLLSFLGTSREELEAMPELDTEYLLDDKYKKK